MGDGQQNSISKITLRAINLNKLGDWKKKNCVGKKLGTNKTSSYSLTQD